MPHLYKILIVAICSLLAACGEPADTHPGQPVTHRRAAFEKILHAFEPMGVQLRAGQYKPDAFLARAKELASVKEGPWQYFGPDTNYPPTHATAKVWSEPAEFDKERQAFLAASGELLLAAESRDEKKVAVAYEVVHQTCRTCHKSFKEQ
ncbi:MAG: cytochrome c [Azonexus sp.]